MSDLWRKPVRHQDGFAAVRLYELENRNRTIFAIQEAVNVHIKRLQDVCTMADKDVIALESSSISRSEQIHLSRQQRSCHIAIKTVDKPNVHRLRELVYTTISMLGHVSAVGEPFLEKRHKSLKPAIQQWSNREVHILAMKTPQ